MNKKICSLCKLNLPETEEYFASRKLKTKITFQACCRSCHKEYRKIHYEANKQKYVDKAKKYRAKSVEWFQKLKSTLSCEICGDTRFWVLDFHHIDPLQKEGNLSNMVRSVSKDKILKELKKCKILCSNCHRDLHYKETQAA